MTSDCSHPSSHDFLPQSRRWQVAPFAFYVHARVSSISPAGGPVEGGTHLRIFGSGFRPGSHHECWLGGGRSNATVHAAGAELRCVTPAAVAVGTQRLQVTLNGQQASDEADFALYAAPALVGLYPDNGDVGAQGEGTLVRVLSDEAGGGFPLGDGNDSDYRCLFGEASQPASHASPYELRCSAPRLSSEGQVRVLSGHSELATKKTCTVAVQLVCG